MSWMHVFLVLACIELHFSHAYRILTSPADPAAVKPAVFEPYVPGGVGYYGDPANPDPERVNEGSPFSPDTPRIYLYETPKQNCPGMVGPINEKEYYCHAREYGYCDRRSGLCVCNQGYTGLDCTECKPSYFKKGNLCYAKKSCPSDCSRAGKCDYLTGTCTCDLNRAGVDCSQVVCKYDAKCTSCTSTKCLSCIEGYYVEPTNQKCVSCKTYDPRCLVCDASGCLECADPILNSIRRSGARSVDDPLPFDELNREFSFKFSYGSQDPRVFDEAEVFELVPVGVTTAYLNESSVSCIQGSNFDASWSCQPNPVSHRVCGHAGVFSFTSPIYAVPEDAQNITLTVQRSGGGYGNASVLYELQHITTSGQDVSPTAFYTSTQILDFPAGVVNKSFLLTIHDDHVVEGDESFRVALRSPSDGSSLGSQWEAFVTILENDATQTDASASFVVPTSGTTLQKGGYAGDTLTFRVQAAIADGTSKTKGGDVFIMESYVADEDVTTDGSSPQSLYRPKLSGTITDNSNGSYTVTWQRKHVGVYTVAVYLLYPGGLRGDYYSNAWFAGQPVVSRIDRRVNFTWNEGPLFPGGSDYVSVRWSGRVQPRVTGDTTFYVSCDDHVRLWIGDILLIDRWSDENDGGVAAQATIALDSTQLYSIVIEYRDLSGSARISLSWSTASIPQEVIRGAYLYSAQHIAGSPFTNVPIQPALTASSATSYLQGTFSTISGIPLALQLFPVDAYGNARRIFDRKVDYYQARLTLVTDLSLGGVGSKTVDCGFAWKPERSTFNVTCIPFFSGSHNLNVYINGALVTGSPFTITVQPNSMNPARSVLSGAGLTVARVAGTATTVSLETRDLNSNRIYTSSGPTTKLVLRAFHATKTGVVDIGTIADNGDGTYTFTYTPRFVGTYQIHATQNGAHIHNSPYTITVVPNVAVGSTSVATGTGLTSATTNVQSSFQIQSRDLNSNDLTAGGATYQVIVEHPVKGNVSGSCTDLLNSRYSCTYTPKYIGTSRLHVGLLASSVFVPVVGSPFVLDVIAGAALGSFCYATGSALASSIAGQQASFSMFIRDNFDNVKANAGTETVSVTFIGPSPSTSAVPTANTGLQITYIGGGTFQVLYTLKVKGSYSIQVTVNGVAVIGSPFAMRQYPALASYGTTTVDLLSPTTLPVTYYAGTSIKARITTRDAFSNVLETGGYLFQFDPAFSNATLVDAMTFTDEQNGSYYLEFTPRLAQMYSLGHRIMYPGGLNASFYPNGDLSGAAKFRRVDPTVDFDYGLYPPPFTDDAETFSIKWSGSLLPRYSELYTFYLRVNGGAQMRINQQSMFQSMWPSATHARGNESIVLTANTLVPIELNFSKAQIVHNASIHLEWESMSQPREIIPSSRLFTAWRYVNNVPSLNIVPGAAYSPAFTVVFPPGSFMSPNVVTVTAGQTFTFFITARDRNSNIRLVGGDTIYAVFPALASAVDITPTVVDYGNATYKVSIYPKLTGDFVMAIAAARPSDNVVVSADKTVFVQNLQPFLVQNSPYTLRVVANKPLATTSTLVGAGLVSATAGVASSFVVELRDVHSNIMPRRVPSSQITVRLRLLVDTSVTFAGSFGDAVDGRLSVSYIAYHTGVFEILLSLLDGVEVQKLSTLRVFPNLANALTSSASGAGLGPQVLARTLQTYQIALRDAYQNPKEVGGNDLAIVIRGPAIVYGDVIDLQNGNYMVQYQLPTAGAYEIQNVLANPGNGLVGYYFDSTRYSVIGLSQVTHWVDPAIDLDWRVNETMRNYPRIQWRGFLKPKFTETYKLRLLVFPAGAVYIDDQPVVDALNNRDSGDDGETTFDGNVALVGGRSHRIVIEYRGPSRQDIKGFIQLQWRSDRQPLQVVPTAALLPDGQELQPRYTILAS